MVDMKQMTSPDNDRPLRRKKQKTEVQVDALQIQGIDVRTVYGPAPSMLRACNARVDERWGIAKPETRGRGKP